MYKVVFIGYFFDFDLIESKIRLEMLKNSLSVEGIYFPNKKSIKQLDSFRILSDEELLSIECDYIVVFSKELMPMVYQICDVVGKWERKNVLMGHIFDIPHFDFEQYIKLHNSQVSILSNNCFGGLLYHTLGMQFRSPFINMFTSADMFLTILEDLENYLSFTPRKIRGVYDEGKKAEYPIMALGDVEIHFNHYFNDDEAIEIWNRRVTRVNYDNIFVACMLGTKEDAERFIRLPYKKIGFADFEFEHETIIDKKIFGTQYFARYDAFYKIVNNQGRHSNEVQVFDVFKLLSGEPDFLRYQLV